MGWEFPLWLSRLRTQLVSIPGLTQWPCLELWYRSQMDLALLWLWCRLAATSPIQSLAWKLPYVTDVALKKKKKREREEKKKRLLGRQKDCSPPLNHDCLDQSDPIPVPSLAIKSTGNFCFDLSEP